MASRWLDSIEEKRDKRKNYYAAIIASAGLVVISMRVLFESWVTITNSIGRLKYNGTSVDCDRVATEVETFSTHERILPTIRRFHLNLAALADMENEIPEEFRPPQVNQQAEDEADNKISAFIQRVKRILAREKHFGLEKKEKEAIRVIIESANLFRENVRDGKSGATPVYDEKGLEHMVASIRSGEKGNLEQAHTESKEIRDHIQRELIKRAEEARGLFEGIIGRTGLPEPLWLDFAQVLEELKKESRKHNNHGDS